MDRKVVAAWLACSSFAVLPVHAAAPAAAPESITPRADSAAYQHLVDAAGAVVGIKVKALANARSNATLGQERTGSGVLIAPQSLVLTIGYLILEADHVELTTSKGRTVPGIVAAYDHATGFGLVRPLAPLDVKAIPLGSSANVDALDRLLVAAGGGEDSLSVATVVSRRQFTGYWEYLIEGAIFTSPPRPDFGGAALINREGQLVGIGSLFVMDAMTSASAPSSRTVASACCASPPTVPRRKPASRRATSSCSSRGRAWRRSRTSTSDCGLRARRASR